MRITVDVESSTAADATTDGPPLRVDDDVARVLEESASRASPAPPTVERMRTAEHAVLALQPPPPPGVVRQTTTLDGVRVTTYRPSPRPLPALVYLHGGGFVIDAGGYEVPMALLAEATGCLVVAPDLRLAPEDPFPAALEDARAGFAAVAEHLDALGARPGRVGLVGDSSGGNLAAVVAIESTAAGRPPAFQVLLYPMLDADVDTESKRRLGSHGGFTREKAQWYFEQYLPPSVDRGRPDVSPLRARDLIGLPPTLLAIPELDPLRDEGLAYSARLREAGVEVTTRRYPGTIHGFFQMSGALASGRRLVRDLGRWIRSATDAPD